MQKLYPALVTDGYFHAWIEIRRSIILHALWNMNPFLLIIALNHFEFIRITFCFSFRGPFLILTNEFAKWRINSSASVSEGHKFLCELIWVTWIWFKLLSASVSDGHLGALQMNLQSEESILAVNHFKLLWINSKWLKQFKAIHSKNWWPSETEAESNLNQFEVIWSDLK